MATRLTTASQDAACAALNALLDAGTGDNATLEVRTGSQPDSANDAATGTVLVTFDLPDPVFGAPTDGEATADDIDPAVAEATGEAGWFRAYDKDGGVVRDGSVSETGEGGELQLDNVSIAQDQGVVITSWVSVMPSGEAA